MSIEIIPKDRKMKRLESILYGIPNNAYKVQSINSKRSSLSNTNTIRAEFMEEKNVLSQ